MSIYKIKLVIETPSIVKFEGRDTFRVKVTATTSQNMPTEIFGFQRTLVDPETDATQDEFCFVCSPYDLSIYPANEPNLSQFPQYFRKSQIDILVPSIQTAEDVITDIQEQVCLLTSLLDKLDDLENLQSVWCSTNG